MNATYLSIAFFGSTKQGSAKQGETLGNQHLGSYVGVKSVRNKQTSLAAGHKPGSQGARLRRNPPKQLKLSCRSNQGWGTKLKRLAGFTCKTPRAPSGGTGAGNLYTQAERCREEPVRRRRGKGRKQTKRANGERCRTGDNKGAPTPRTDAALQPQYGCPAHKPSTNGTQDVERNIATGTVKRKRLPPNRGWGLVATK